jgi:hypothetical protein
MKLAHECKEAAIRRAKRRIRLAKETEELKAQGSNQPVEEPSKNTEVIAGQFP